jgi:hypothetical protein
LQFSLQAASPDTFGCTLVFNKNPKRVGDIKNSGLGSAAFVFTDPNELTAQLKLPMELNDLLFYFLWSRVTVQKLTVTQLIKEFLTL